MNTLYVFIYDVIGVKFNFISFFCSIWLSLYFIFSFTILINRIFIINSWIDIETKTLEKLMLGNCDILNTSSFLKKFNGNFDKLSICKNMVIQKSTKGLTFLSIVASTSPFIGLFATIVSILITFTEFGTLSNVGLNVLAPKISEALVVTALGILVAIPAYTFHLIIKRKVFCLMSIIDNEIHILQSCNKD